MQGMELCWEDPDITCVSEGTRNMLSHISDL